MPLYSIFITVIFPIFFMIAVGFFIQKRFKFDITALTKMIFYALIPPLIFSRIYQSTLSLQEVGIVMLFTFGMIVIMGLISLPISWVRGYRPAVRAAFALSVMFCNSGNYGLPVAELVFHQNPVATSIQAAVLTMQNITTFTLGIFLVSKGNRSYRDSFRTIFRYPLIYSFFAAFLFRELHIPLWSQMWVPIERMASALVPVALLTLGTQLAKIRLTSSIVDVILSGMCRLLLAPLLGFTILKLFHFSGVPAQVLLISTSMPTAVNTALLALEMDNEPQFAAQSVLFSTVLSIASVSATIFAARALF